MNSTRLALVLTIVGLAALGVGCSSDVKIGAIVSESGAVAAYGDSVRKGMDLALEEINANNEYAAGSFEILYRDDETDAEKGKQVAQELLDEDVNAMIGAISSRVTEAIIPILDKARVPIISPSASAASLTGASPYFFRNFPSDILEGTAMARFAAEELEVEKVAIFVLDDTYGQGLVDIFRESFENNYRSVVAQIDYTDDGDATFEEIARQLTEMAPEAIYIVSYIEETTKLLAALEAAGSDSILLASGSVTPELIQRAGTASETLIYPQASYDPESDDPAVAEFVRDYRAKYNEDPDIYAAHGYDAVRLILRATEIENNAMPSSIRDGLAQVQNYQGAAGVTQFDKLNDVVRYPGFHIVRDGVSIPFDRFKSEGGSLPGRN